MRSTPHLDPVLDTFTVLTTAILGHGGMDQVNALFSMVHERLSRLGDTCYVIFRVRARVRATPPRPISYLGCAPMGM